MKTYKLELSEDLVKAVLLSLQEQPLKVSHGAWASITRQCEEQDKVQHDMHLSELLKARAESIKE